MFYEMLQFKYKLKITLSNPRSVNVRETDRERSYSKRNVCAISVGLFLRFCWESCR